jgi:YfiH family protein
MLAMSPDWLQPVWPDGKPLPNVGTLMTTRAGGHSVAPWESLNLGIAVGDDPAAVARNRAAFAEAIGAAPVFMRQVHGTRVLRLTAAHAIPDAPIEEADACITTEPGVACVVQVADCLPVLMAAPQGRAVGAAHAGWRGLAAGILDATVRAVCEAAGCEPKELQCWLGPCIGPSKFEVGADVLAGFGVGPETNDALRFKPGRPGKWLANLPRLARDRLQAAGVVNIAGGEWCTVSDASRFFSFRRDGVTGRMAAAIWIRR